MTTPATPPPAESGPIAGHYCGQTQPHDAHVWQTPTPFGSTAIAMPRQCAGASVTVERSDPPSEGRDGPHSRACGWRPHEHGPACHKNCPTCGGYDLRTRPGVESDHG